MKNGKIPTWIIVWSTTLFGGLVVFFSNPTAVDRLFEDVGLNRILYPEGRSLFSQRVFSTMLSTPFQDETEVPFALSQNHDSPHLEVATEQDEPIDQNVQTEPAFIEKTVEKTTDRLLYFLGLDPEGRSVLFPFKRELQEGMTPLTTSLKALLLGPTIQEKNQGAFTLIPQKVRLLSLKIEDKIAFLNFNQEFLHNPQGLEGFASQLKQFTWTATQFPSIEKVQFLINGQRRDFLAEEGLSLAAPFQRSSFP